MGLAAPKNRTKIAKDPRNLFWSSDTSRFGHQHLRSLGWTPGEALGDKSSSYHASGHITDASWAGVKIAPKDDNLGIGAKAGAEDECTGLLGLQGLLGRLNGDEKAVERVRKEEQRRREEYFVARWGMRFVRGEVWRGEEFGKLREKKEGEGGEKEEGGKVVGEVRDDKGRKRRKRNDDADSKETKGQRKEEAQQKVDVDAGEPKDKVKKRRKSKSRSASASASTSDAEAGPQGRKKSKRDRGDRKEEAKSEEGEKEKRKKKKKRKASEPEASLGLGEEETSCPAASQPAAASSVGRHAIRARFIAAKKSATMDSKSLNEILMVTA